MIVLVDSWIVLVGFLIVLVGFLIAVAETEISLHISFCYVNAFVNANLS
jgi:hypothetical protein